MGVVVVREGGLSWEGGGLFAYVGVIQRCLGVGVGEGVSQDSGRVVSDIGPVWGVRRLFEMEL